MKIVILNSGGLDSFIMSEMARKENPDADIVNVYFDIGHDYAYKEIEAIRKNGQDVDIWDVSWLSSKGRGKADNGMNNIFIPGRNMLLATMAAAKYVPDEIWLGALCGEIHQFATDKNLKFRDDMTGLLSYVMSPFLDNGCKIVYPFVDKGWGKLQVVEWAVNNGLKDQVIASSSCMSPENGNCGRCGVCIRRAGIFRQLGFDEQYNNEPFLAPENKKLIIQILEAERDQDSSHYDKYRREEIVPSIVNYFGESDYDKLIKMIGE